MSCGTMRAGRAVEATNSGSLREPNSNARRGRQKDTGARLFARRKSPSRSTATPREPSRRRPAQRMRKPLRFRAVRDLSRPTPTRTALKPDSREGRRNQRLRQFGHPEKRQSRTLGQANRLRRHRNRNPVMALKRLRRNGRSGKSRRPAILEYGPSPDAAGGRRYRKPNYARGRDAFGGSGKRDRGLAHQPRRPQGKPGDPAARTNSPFAMGPADREGAKRDRARHGQRDADRNPSQRVGRLESVRIVIGCSGMLVASAIVVVGQVTPMRPRRPLSARPRRDLETSGRFDAASSGGASF